VIAALATGPAQADESFFQFPAWVEICRARKGLEVPADLEGSYLEALARIPDLVAQASGRRWEPGFAACALAAVAAAKGQHAVAEALFEMSSPEVAEEFIEWRSNQ
jgi:hypothetical protein